MPPVLPLAAETALPGMSPANDSPKARAEAAKQFEALLLGELMKAMRATASFGNEEGDAFARGSYEEMFDRSLVDAAAGGLGIAQLFEQQNGPRTSARTSFEQAPRPAGSLLPAASDGPAIQGRGAATKLGTNGRDPWSPSPIEKSSPERTGIGSSFDAALPTAGLWPVDGGVKSSDYGFRTHPIHGDKRFHAGLDIAAPEGREIRAVQRGVVTFAGRHKGFGNMVELTHPDGIVTRYAHASRLHVREGDVVDVGETIADVGSTGQSTGPHLHFEVRDGHRTLNPATYLERLRHGSDDASASGPRPRTGVAADEVARDVNPDDPENAT